MLKTPTTTSILRVAMISVAFLPFSAQAAQFQVGTATVEITPPVGYHMSGYFHERLSQGTK